jgi:hypothetical protein
MSGLYNIVFGYDPAAPVVLVLLGVEPTKTKDIPRFRDAWVDAREESPRLVIYTRTGGANRQEYEVGIAELRQLPGYLGDEDDPFDTTYASFYYAVPDKYKALVADIVSHGFARTDTPGDRWLAAINQIKPRGKPE